MSLKFKKINTFDTIAVTQNNENFNLAKLKKRSSINNNDTLTDISNYEETHTGYRKRIIDRFMQHQNASYLDDYEVLEMLLFFIYPKNETRQIATSLINKFGNIRAFFELNQELQEESNLQYDVKYIIKLISEIILRISRSKISHSNKHFTDIDDIAEYIKNSIGTKNEERFMVVFLNAKHNVIGETIFEDGGVDFSNINTRELMKKTINIGAKYIIISHNHPSGDIEPSTNDIETTYAIIEAMKKIDVEVTDHIIVSKNSKFSFKERHLI